MRRYETIVITDPELPDEEVNGLVSTFSTTITDRQGQILKSEDWGRKKLAYEINKKTEGTYFCARLTAPAAAIAELTRQLRYDEQVLRTLIVRDEDWSARNEAAARRPAAAS